MTIGYRGTYGFTEKLETHVFEHNTYATIYLKYCIKDNQAFYLIDYDKMSEYPHLKDWEQVFYSYKQAKLFFNACIEQGENNFVTV